VAFAVPVYENRQLVRRHWLSLSVGVVASVIMAVGSTVLLARWLDLSDMLQRSLAMRSITDIAFAWGFNNGAHGSRVFLEHTGLTPGEFRKAAQRQVQSVAQGGSERFRGRQLSRHAERHPLQGVPRVGRPVGLLEALDDPVYRVRVLQPLRQLRGAD